MKKINLTLIFLFLFFSGFAQLAWLKLADFPGNGWVGTSYFSINGKGYVGLGFSASNLGTTEMYEYDPASNVWTQKASIPGARYTCVPLVINNKGYIVSGYKSGATKEVWEYDPATNVWTQKALFPGVGRTNAAGFIIGNKGYVGTGYAGGQSYVDFYEFDPVANTWTQKADFIGAPRNGAATFTIGNYGYLGIGNATNSTSNLPDFFRYDPVANSWSQISDFPITHSSCPSTYSTSSAGYVLCGYYWQQTGITHNPLNTLYKYDPVNDEWTLPGTFRGYPRGYAGSFQVGNDIYIMGGAQSNDGDANLMLHDLWKLSNGLTLMQEDPTGSTDFKIYPNPATENIYVETGSQTERLDHIRIYDSAGRLVMQKQLNNQYKDEINVSSLNTGLYFVELITKDKQVLDSRFVKK